MSTLSLGTSVIEHSLSCIAIMVSKKDGSNNIVESNTGDMVEQVPMNLPIYAYTQLFAEKDMKITWQETKDNHN